MSRRFNIGRIAEQGQNAVISQFAKPNKICHPACYRRYINFKVSRMNHRTDRSADCECNCIRNTVVNADKLNGKTADPEYGARFFCKDLSVVKQILLFQLQFNQRCGQRRGINRNIQFLQHERNCPDMVFMTVCNDHAPDTAGIVAQVSDIRKHHINAVHVLIRESHAAIDNNQVVPEFNHGHVFPDFSQTAKRDYFQFRCHSFSLIII